MQLLIYMDFDFDMLHLGTDYLFYFFHFLFLASVCIYLALQSEILKFVDGCEKDCNDRNTKSQSLRAQLSDGGDSNSRNGNIRNGGSMRSTIYVLKSIGSPSSVAETSNNQSPRETEIRIPDCTTLNDRSSTMDTFREKQNERPSRSNNEEKDGNNAVLGSSDCIPIDIVELMAKNQYERTLGNAFSKLVIPHSNVNNIRRLLDLQVIRNTERHPDVGTSGSNGFRSKIKGTLEQKKENLLTIVILEEII